MREKPIGEIDRLGYEKMAMDFWKWAYLIGIIIIAAVFIFGCFLVNSMFD